MPWTVEALKQFDAAIRLEPRQRWFRAIEFTKDQPEGQIGSNYKGHLKHTYMNMVMNYNNWNEYFRDFVQKELGDKLPEPPAPDRARAFNGTRLILGPGLRWNGWNVEEVPA